MEKLKDFQSKIDRFNSSDVVEDSKNVKDKVSGFKKKNIKEYNEALSVAQSIMSLDSKYASILYDVYIVGKKEKELDQLNEISKSTVNRRHMMGLKLMEDKLNLNKN
jgi:DNA-directed RNA polymerase specialized sigma subunit